MTLEYRQMRIMVSGACVTDVAGAPSLPSKQNLRPFLLISSFSETGRDPERDPDGEQAKQNVLRNFCSLNPAYLI
jgi:hypothetical protein